MSFHSRQVTVVRSQSSVTGDGDWGSQRACQNLPQVGGALAGAGRLPLNSTTRIAPQGTEVSALEERKKRDGMKQGQFTNERKRACTRRSWRSCRRPKKAKSRLSRFAAKGASAKPVSVPGARSSAACADQRRAAVARVGERKRSPQAASGRARLGVGCGQGGFVKKLVAAPQKRQFVVQPKQKGRSERGACRLVALSRTVARYRAPSQSGRTTSNWWSGLSRVPRRSGAVAIVNGGRIIPKTASEFSPLVAGA